MVAHHTTFHFIIYTEQDSTAGGLRKTKYNHIIICGYNFAV